MQSTISEMEQLLSEETAVALDYSSRYLSFEQSLLKRLHSLIEMHYKTQHDPKFYAKQLNISYRQLSRICLNKLGKTPNTCLQERLHLEAIRLLTYTKMPVKEITYELGVTEPAYFSRCFKKLTGKSPSEYREVNAIKLPESTLKGY